MAGRLETRKGIKLFIDAVQLLDLEQLDPRFEVTFIGMTSEIDNQLSTTWLDLHMKDWRWKSRFFVGTWPTWPAFPPFPDLVLFKMHGRHACGLRRVRMGATVEGADERWWGGGRGL